VLSFNENSLFFFMLMKTVIRPIWKIAKSDNYIHYVCLSPSVLMEQLCSHWMDFHEIWYLIRITCTLHEDLWWYLAEFFLEWEMFQTEVVEKIKTRILCSITSLQKLCPYEIMWYNSRPRMANNTIQKRCDLHAGYLRLE
jgi:hypothetical protein